MNGMLRVLAFGWLATPFGLAGTAGPPPARVADNGNDGDPAATAADEPQSQVVRNPFDVEATILQLLPEGRKVTKGDRVCQIDVSALWEQLEEQMELTIEALADYEEAEKTLEVAKINLEEYQQGIFPVELRTAEGAIKLADSDWDRARNRVRWMRHQHEAGLASRLEVLQEELELLRTKRELKKAELARHELVKHRRDQQVRLLEGDIAQARLDLSAKKDRFEASKQKEQELRDKIGQGMLYAPIDGVVRHAGEFERDSAVKPRQPILEIVPAERVDTDREDKTTEENDDTTSEAEGDG